MTHDSKTEEAARLKEIAWKIFPGITMGDSERFRQKMVELDQQITEAFNVPRRLLKRDQGHS